MGRFTDWYAGLCERKVDAAFSAIDPNSKEFCDDLFENDRESSGSRSTVGDKVRGFLYWTGYVLALPHFPSKTHMTLKDSINSVQANRTEKDYQRAHPNITEMPEW